MPFEVELPLSPGKTGVFIFPKWDEGDVRLEWDQNKPVEVETIRQQFMELKAKGFKAYRMDPKSNTEGEVLKEFDPKAEKIIMRPAFAGG